MRAVFVGAAMVLAMSIPAMSGPSGGHGSDHGTDHGAGHGMDHSTMMPAGMPGNKAEARRAIRVKMKETDDGKMIFTPNNFAVKKGETVRIKISNRGELEHEFVLDTHENNQIHKELMAKQPDEAAHQMPNAITLQPGEKGEIVWTFSNAGEFEFACLILGHYESGMFGTASVS